MADHLPKHLIAVVLLLAIQGVAMKVHAGDPLFETGKIHRGSLLVADSRLFDGFFGRSVVLVIRRDSSGTYGLIINRPGQLNASDVWPQRDWSATDPSVFFGGPVEMGRVRILFHNTKPPGLGSPVIDDVWLIEDQGELTEYANAPPAFTETRVFVGYAGWAPGQLEMEVGRGDWRIIKGKTTDIFSTDPDALWERLDQSLRQIWTHLSRGSDIDENAGY